MTIILRLLRLLITLAIVAVAIFIVIQIWYVYVLAPWTRDGRVFAQTVVVAVWILINVYGLTSFDVYPFILLNLAFSTQAAYAAPLILLAQTRKQPAC